MASCARSGGWTMRDLYDWKISIPHRGLLKRVWIQEDTEEKGWVY